MNYGHLGEDEKLTAAWIRFSADRNQKDRNYIASFCQGIVARMAMDYQRGLPSNIHFHDLMSSGNLGLVEAIDGFNIERVNKFLTFARPFIMGRMADEVRNIDHLPRIARELSKEISRQRDEMAAVLGRSVSIEETNIKGDRLSGASRYWKSLPSLKSIKPSNAERCRPMRSSRSGCDQVDDRDMIHAMMRRLQWQYRRVLEMHCLQNKTMREIGDVIGVDSSRASQMHTDAIKSLRSRFSQPSRAA